MVVAGGRVGVVSDSRLMAEGGGESGNLGRDLAPRSGKRSEPVADEAVVETEGMWVVDELRGWEALSWRCPGCVPESGVLGTEAKGVLRGDGERIAPLRGVRGNMS